MSAIHCESSPSTKIYKASTLFTCFKLLFLYTQKSPPGLKPLRVYRRLYMTGYRVLGLKVSELHDLRMVCFFKAVTPGWRTNTIPCMLADGYIHYHESFGILRAKMKSLLCPARLAVLAYPE